MRKLLDPIYKGAITRKAREHYLGCLVKFSEGETVLEIGAGDALMASTAIKSTAKAVYAMDIKYPENSEIVGRVEIQADVLGDSIDRLEVNLMNDMNVDRVTVFGELTEYTHADHLITVSLQRIRSQLCLNHQR